LVKAAPLPLRPPGWKEWERESRFIERWSWAMGQPVHLMLFAASEDQGLEVAAEALAELRRVEARLTLFDSGSDLVALNQRAGRGWVDAGEDLLAALAAAESIRSETRAAFDPAVEPLMVAWGFHRRRSEAPSPIEIAEARSALAATTVTIQGGRVRLDPTGAALDLGGIGVGYGLDRAAGVLRRRGIASAFLDISGDCIALEPPPGAAGWRVDIADPVDRGAVRGSVLLRRSALATSANTQSTVRYGAMVRGHVLDPATGFPAHRVRQATVVAATGVAADALSTATLVAGRAMPGATETIIS
jgi:thiamine biosynthesis lipoprotein